MAAQTRQDLITALLSEFPDLQAELKASSGVLTSEMGTFALFTQDAKERGDLGTYERCLKLADRLFDQADAALSGAFRTSYLEHLEFEGSVGRAAWQLVPPRLQAVWNQLAAENRRLQSLPQRHGQQQRGEQRGQQQRGPQERGAQEPRREQRKKRSPRRGRRR
jgi:hypothetical protein